MTEFNVEEYATKLYADVKAQFPDDKLTTANTFELLRLSMEIVDTYTGLAGQQKKELVLNVLHRAFDDLVVDEIDNEAVKVIVDTAADYIIDHFVDIDLGNLNLEHHKSKLKKWFPCCFKSK